MDHGYRTYLSKDGKTGFAIAPDGDLANVFSLNHNGWNAIELGIKEGATKLDCFDGKLPKIYAEHGFVEYKREANWTPGEPDNVYMHLQGAKTMKDKQDEKTDLEKFRDKKRHEMIEWMKEHDITYEQAEDAVIDMIGKKKKGE